MARALPFLPAAAWAAVVAAAVLDREHDLLAHYISWLVDGQWAWLATVGVLGMGAATALIARHLHGVMDAGAPRDMVVASLVSATVVGLATVVLPSRGFGEPLWRTATHLGLAVGSYTGVAGAAFILAWLAWRGRAPRSMIAWAFLLLAAVTALVVAAGVARFTDRGIEVRGLAQLTLGAVAAAWLARAARLRRVG